MWPSRRVAPKDDLDLTPPEELQARQRRRLFFLGVLAAAVLGTAVYFAAPPIHEAIKGWQSRRLAHQAFTDGANNGIKPAPKRATLLLADEPEAWRAFAPRLPRLPGCSALEWWKN
jgi:hypothetical protein